MSGWTPPASGTPCWINIPAQDVKRARDFYSTVFDWAFEDSTNTEKYPPENIAFFHPPDRKSSPSGAISKAESTHHTKLRTPNIGNAGLYLYVDDLATYMKKIVSAGGKEASEVISEGFGFMQHWEDPEGNYFGIYTVGSKDQE